ncbi:FAD/NAD(P)-binding protein [Streptomyces sp. NPDC003006]
MQRIVVIGAGPAGASLVENLAARLREPCALTVVDGTRHLWRGRAYQRDDTRVLTNIPAAHMSVREDDPSHAEHWLASQHPGATDADGLTARAHYGAYLENTLRDTWQRLARRGWRLRLVREHASRVSWNGTHLTVSTAPGALVCEPAEHVVLCTGPPAPADPYRLSGIPDYVAEPFPLGRKRVPPGCRVGVIGAGLTAVDIVAWLTAHGHHGPIRLFSRSGLLPAVRKHPADHQLRHLTLARLDALAGSDGTVSERRLMSLLQAELTAAGVDQARLVREFLAPDPPADRLRRQLAAADEDRDLGEAVLHKALPRFAGHAWNLLPDAEKAALWQRHHRAITSLCCPMPRHRGQLLLRLLDKGQLQLTDGVTRVEPAPAGGFTVRARSARVSVDVLFNAVGPATHRPPLPAERGVETELARDFSAGHPLGGLRTDPRTHQVEGVPGLYALGHPTRGAVMFHFGMPSLVHQSGLIARCIDHRVAPSKARATIRTPVRPAPYPP